MQYRKLVKDGDELSVLGFGCMRFQSKNGIVDEKLAHEQLLLAFNEGVNYYDTAYPYHAGRSEGILGRFIKKNNIRKQVYIADKMPAYLVTKPEQFESFFNTQLKRLDTDYIDYYLMHMLDSMQTWERLKSFGLLEFIEEKKKSGAIRHIGFSFHGKQEEFISILEDYDWEFCQIQYNYLDENNQAGLKGLIRANELGIGVVVMEPLRGGNLASKAPDKVIKRFEEYSENSFNSNHENEMVDKKENNKDYRSPAFWALRWIWNHPGVAVILSGMNMEEHIRENIHVANITHPNSMSEEELKVIEDVKVIYRELMKVPCTGCNYCMPCPFNVDIPGIFADYNSKSFFGGRMAAFQYIGRIVGMYGGKKSGADQCTQCGLCEKHCPQNIEIRKELKKAHKELDNPLVRFVLGIGTRILGLRHKEK